MNYIILAVVAVVSFFIGRKTSAFGRKVDRSFASKQPEELKEIQKKSREALAERTEDRKEKILSLMTIGATHGEALKACGVEDIKKGITSKNVKRFLGVSVITARKYLNELEKEDKIKQIGKTGRVPGELLSLGSIQSTFGKIGDVIKKTVNQVGKIACKAVKNPSAGAIAGGIAATQGIPPQTGATGVRIASGVCPAGTVPITTPAAAAMGMPSWALPAAIGGGALLLVIALK